MSLCVKMLHKKLKMLKHFTVSLERNKKCNI